jgi:FkbM family methyltransferase
MTFISYAQNFEDVLLWRALGHIKNGFYIDVGANDPEEHSVTRAFYDAGWHGINVEPLPSYAEAFREQRPRDINLSVAAGGSEGSITLYDVASIPGWASPEAAVAEMHRKEGHEVRELTVPMRTLSAICAEHVRGDIHFLKVDVEGYEAEVLRGMDFSRFRPWIVVVEATTPNSRASAHEGWDALVTGQRYSFAWFDGLNRYYVADEHPELKAALAVQPNVFDAFITHHLDKAWRDARKAHKSNAALEARVAKESEQRWHAEQRADREQAIAHEALALSREQLGRLNELLEAQQAQTRELVARDSAAQAELAALKVDKARLTDTLAAQAQQHAALAAYAEQVRNELQKKLDEAHWHGHQAQLWARDLEQRLVATHASTSWRITEPLRRAGALVRRVRGGSARALLGRAVRKFTASERMRRLLIPVMLRFPGLGRRVTSMLATIKQATPAPSTAAALAPDIPEMPAEIKALPQSARRVAEDLQRALHPNRGN